MILTDLTQVQALLPDYTGGRYSVRYNTNKEIIEYNQEGKPITENTNSPSGWRADVIEQERIVTPAEYDAEGNITTEAVTETVYDVRVPDWVESKIPERVDKYKLEIILEEMNLLDTVNQIISQADFRTRTAWAHTPFIRRDSPAIDQMAPLIGLTNTQLDKIFIEADKITI